MKSQASNARSVGAAMVVLQDGNPAKVAVKGLTLAVEEGECFGLLGPNGAGKSSAIHMLVGLQEPTSGLLSSNPLCMILAVQACAEILKILSVAKPVSLSQSCQA